jgi:hypothetical protein
MRKLPNIAPESDVRYLDDLFFRWYPLVTKRVVLSSKHAVADAGVRYCPSMVGVLW